MAARVLLGATLIFSGASKVSAPSEEFAVVIEAYNLVPADAAQSLAALLPWAELVLGFALLLGYFTQQAALAAAAMLVVFIGAILSTKARGIELPNCGCFGASFHPKPMVTVALDALLLVTAAAAYAYGACRISLDNWANGGYTSASS